MCKICYIRNIQTSPLKNVNVVDKAILDKGYWCGHLSHDDKECSMWLSSKGDLSEVEQEFGPWLRASQFNPTRKTTVEVQGFDGGGNHRNSPGRIEVGDTRKGKCMKTVPTVAGVENNDVVKMRAVGSLSSAPLEMGSSDGAQTRDKRVHDRDMADPQVQISDFEAMIQDIDEAINTDSAVLISEAPVSESSPITPGNNQLVGINGDSTENLGSQDRILEKVEPQLTSQNSMILLKEFMFEMGRVDKVENKACKGGPKKGGGKGKNKLRPSNGPVESDGGLKKETTKGPTRGSWIRLRSGLINQDGIDYLEEGKDPKRKYVETTNSMVEATCMGKKQRLEEETKSLSILMASQLGSAEVAEQLCRVQ